MSFPQNGALYILMRNDMASMNAGKAVAQGAHAAHVFAGYLDNYLKDTNKDSDVLLSVKLRNWRDEGDGFGTVIVLAASGELIEHLIHQTLLKPHILSGLIYDKTYPIRDGLVTHHIDILTCGFIFMYDGMEHNFRYHVGSSFVLDQIKSLELYP